MHEKFYFNNNDNNTNNNNNIGNNIGKSEMAMGTGGLSIVLVTEDLSSGVFPSFQSDDLREEWRILRR